jgi:hypothetical protein
VTLVGARRDQPALVMLAGGAKVEEHKEGRPDGEVVLTASNLGDVAVNATQSPVTLADKLPPGVVAVSIEGVAGEQPGSGSRGPVECDLASLTCVFKEGNEGKEGTLPPYYTIEVVIRVVVESPPSEENEGSVSGGGVAGAVVRRAVPVGEAPAKPGVEDYELSAEEEGGASDTQAGSHPFQLTTTLTLNQKLVHSTGPSAVGQLPQPVEMPKDVNVKWPAGLVGNATAVPHCTLGQLLTPNSICPQQTAVGVVAVSINRLHENGHFNLTVPLFNLEPSIGEPARFAFVAGNAVVYIDPSIRTGEDYGITVSVSNIDEVIDFISSKVTVWGVPGDSRHDASRGWGCLEASSSAQPEHPCKPSEEPHPAPFLTLPTSCSGPLQSSATTDSWVQPGVFSPPVSSTQMPALDGCNRLPSTPSLEVAPDGQEASTPTGLAVDVHVPQDLTLNATGLAEADVKDTTVVMPQGVVLNPAAADGLSACSLAQIALSSPEASQCPNASKVGEVEISTPLLPSGQHLKGGAYVAEQNANPFGSLVALYVYAEEPISGSRVKLAGKVEPDPATGQLVATFQNTPQLPFEDFKLHFFGGNRAPLATPPRCGSYTTTATIAPWSGNPAVGASSSPFAITTGPNGAPCEAALGFAPTLAVGTSNIQAGGFTPLTTTFSREDGQQNLQGIQLHMPPGLSGLLSNVKLCPEAQANEGTCGPESEIGETTVSVGLGGDPFSVKGGKVYITGPYEGAPFGLSIVNPAKAGPYDLGKGVCDCIVVRAKIDVDPHTAALTVTTDNSGPYRIPTILDGIPLEIKHVNVTINREHFTFNPTNCSPLSVAATISSTEQATATLTEPFQVANCAALAFRPTFKATTSGHTSKANGASLTVKLTYPNAPFGTQANIARVKVDLPKQLPSRLTTLQQACTAAQFNTNPAGCPAGSLVGHARAITPLLPVPLEGPAYFVSHGGEAFPSLIMVLQGYGVTLDLVGNTFISKKGITSSTFATVPDAPVGSFELTLPQGRYSALAANANLCTASKHLTMPTEFIAQNGQTIHTTTPITVTHCTKPKPKHKPTHRATRHTKPKHRHK